MDGSGAFVYDSVDSQRWAVGGLHARLSFASRLWYARFMALYGLSGTVWLAIFGRLASWCCLRMTRASNFGAFFRPSEQETILVVTSGELRLPDARTTLCRSLRMESPLSKQSCCDCPRCTVLTIKVEGGCIGRIRFIPRPSATINGPSLLTRKRRTLMICPISSR